MVQECKFDKKRDIQEARPGLCCDITDAREKGLITDIGVCDEYNGFGDPEQVGSIVRNVFDQADGLRLMAKKVGGLSDVPSSSAPISENPSKGE